MSEAKQAYSARAGNGNGGAPKRNQVDELLDLVTSYTGTKTMMVDGELALAILQMNTDNRRLHKNVVAEFVRRINEGEWINTGEPVIISREGIVNDGQHRLEAIIKTGRTVEMDIRFGVPRAAFVATGTGKTRNNSDILGISGVPNASHVAAVARMMHNYEGPNWPISSSNSASPAQILATLDRHPLMEDMIRMSRASKLPALRTTWFGFVLLLAAEAADRDHARLFALAVQDGTMDDNNGANRLRNRLIVDAMSRAKLRTPDRIILGVKAWNGWIERRPVIKLAIVDSDRTRAGFPRVSSGPKRGGA